MDSMSCILKYVIIGDSSVGKSSLLLRLTDPGFNFGMTEPTLGVEFGSRVMQIDDFEDGDMGSGSGNGEGKRVKVQCWDTAGTESFRSITRSYFRGAAGALLVYDVTKLDSFEHVTSWLKDLRAHADENVSIILVANKTDLCYNSPPPPPISPNSTNGETSNNAIKSPDLNNESRDINSSTSTAQAKLPPDRKLIPRAVTTAEGMRYAKENDLLYVETSAKEGWNVVEAFERTAREVLRKVTQAELDRRKPKGVRLDKSARTKGSCC